MKARRTVNCYWLILLAHKRYTDVGKVHPWEYSLTTYTHKNFHSLFHIHYLFIDLSSYRYNSAHSFCASSLSSSFVFIIAFSAPAPAPGKQKVADWIGPSNSESLFIRNEKSKGGVKAKKVLNIICEQCQGEQLNPQDYSKQIDQASFCWSIMLSKVWRLGCQSRNLDDIFPLVNFINF